MKKIILILFSTIMPVIFAEKFIPFISKDITPRETRFISLREHNPLKIEYTSPNTKELINSENLIIKKYRLKVDNDGYIYPSHIHESPDLKILFLGGSTTECRYVNEKKRFPYLVGRKLEKSLNKKINSYNAGVAGNTTIHSINSFLNKGIRKKPDIAVMMHNVNDLAVLVYEGSYWNDHPTRSLVKKNSYRTGFKHIARDWFPNLYNRLRILKLQNQNKQNDNMISEFKRDSLNPEEINQPLINNLFFNNLNTFIEISKANNIKPILMTQANRFTENPEPIVIKHFESYKLKISYKQYSKIYKEFNDIIRRTAKQKNIKLIDLAKEIPPKGKYLYDTVHLTQEGSIKATEIISNDIYQLLK